MLESDNIKELIKIVHDFYVKEFELWAKTDVDGLTYMDDWGSQQALLISPDMWRTLFKPLYKEYVDIAHANNKKVFMHSDGYIKEYNMKLLTRWNWLVVVVVKSLVTLVQAQDQGGITAIQDNVGNVDTNIAAYAAAPIDRYEIYKDEGMVYNPLSREAAKTGQLKKYDNVPKMIEKVDFGTGIATFKIPEKITAYEVVPINYTISAKPTQKFPFGIEATAYDDGNAPQGDFFDLSIPGNIDLKVEYLGSITAKIDPQKKHRMQADFSDQPGEYPGYNRRAFVRSGIVEAGDLIWYKFKITNTGNTILDSEGVGAAMFSPYLLKKNEAGDYVEFTRLYNFYKHFDDYFYPGDTIERWIIFRDPSGPAWESYNMYPGDYKIQWRLNYRRYTDDKAAINYWDGPVIYTFEQPIKIREKAEKAPVQPGKVVSAPNNTQNKFPVIFHSYEEFMTAFDLYLKKPTERKIKGTLYLQVAPWTKKITLRLVTAPNTVKCAHVPVEVETDSVTVDWNPDCSDYLIENGLKVPVFKTQTMADMRANVQVSPFPEHHIVNHRRMMKEHGVNLLSTTSMPWIYQDADESIPYSYAGDACKYFLDAARDNDVWIEGWGLYPFNRSTAINQANWISRSEQFSKMQKILSGYGDNDGTYICYDDPQLPKAIATIIKYHFERWGDLWYQSGDGSVPLSIGEDTRGWLRDDINVRFPIGPKAVKDFQVWVKKKYKTIDKTNRAWGTSYKSFDKIDPETHIKDVHGLKWRYWGVEHPFKEWDAAVEDYDIWRTLVRVKNYKDTIEIIKEFIPNAKTGMRTEGGNALVAGINPTSPNAHYRHLYYNQRRIAAVAEILVRHKTISHHSDYTTIPYTPSELRQLVHCSITQGITPEYLPYFRDMRDVVLNEKYGLDYTIHYNVDKPIKGYMNHVVTASFPWYKIMAEEGGIPGVLWDDFLCVGFVTATQRKEMKFFQKKLKESMETPEMLSKRKVNIKDIPDDSWRKKSKAMRSYYGFDLN